MPRLTLTIPNRPSAWTKTPNELVDRLMPTLGDTELRILLFLVRQTAGWNRPGSAVTLTYRTLTARTGRRSEAVSNALRSLAAKGLIHSAGRRSRRFPK
jgi:phage replication O-like protein O